MTIMIHTRGIVLTLNLTRTNAPKWLPPLLSTFLIKRRLTPLNQRRFKRLKKPQKRRGKTSLSLIFLIHNIAQTIRNFTDAVHILKMPG